MELVPSEQTGQSGPPFIVLLMLTCLRIVGLRATRTRNLRTFSTTTIRHAVVDTPSKEGRGLTPMQLIRNIAIIAHGW